MDLCFQLAVFSLSLPRHSFLPRYDATELSILLSGPDNNLAILFQLQRLTDSFYGGYIEEYKEISMTSNEV